MSRSLSLTLAGLLHSFLFHYSQAAAISRSRLLSFSGKKRDELARRVRFCSDLVPCSFSSLVPETYSQPTSIFSIRNYLQNPLKTCFSSPRTLPESSRLHCNRKQHSFEGLSLRNAASVTSVRVNLFLSCYGLFARHFLRSLSFRVSGCCCRMKIAVARLLGICRVRIRRKRSGSSTHTKCYISLLYCFSNKGSLMRKT